MSGWTDACGVSFIKMISETENETVVVLMYRIERNTEVPSMSEGILSSHVTFHLYTEHLVVVGNINSPVETGQACSHVVLCISH